MLNSKLSLQKTLLIASMIFGVIFGAGNLIFPIHLGQLAGSNWLSASSGFLVSSALLPLMAFLAISITKTSGVYELAKPIGAGYALLFLILVHATLGPFFATPRTATVPFSIGIAPNLPKSMHGIGLLIYSAIFFAIVFFFSIKEGKITDLIGKFLNPIFLLLLFGIFLLAFMKPLGSAQSAAATTAYQGNSFANGFLQGYNTMDGLGAITFGITIITSVRSLGIKREKDLSIAAAKSSAIGVLGIAMIYICLIWLGASSLHHFKLADNGGTTLAQIVHYYLGPAGNALLATLTTITCLTTAMGLIVAFAQDFHKHFPKISYKTFLAVNCLISFGFANLGLNNIISWSKPVLMLLYPLAISLIIMGILSPLFKNDPVVYRITTALTFIPATFDMINALPDVLRNTQLAQGMISFAQKSFPFFNLGFGWLCFAIGGFIIALCIHFTKRKFFYATIEE